MAKRSRELAKQLRQKEKEARRAQRKEKKQAAARRDDGKDPDLAGMKWGPQAPLY
jgi:hypothetical protein